MSTWLPMCALLHLLSYMQICVALCVCSNQPTPYLACVHALVHVLISTWLPMSDTPLGREVSPPTGGLISDQRCHLQLEAGPPIIVGTSDQRWDFHLEVRPPFQEDLSTPIGVTWKPGCSCVALCVSQSPCCWSHTLIKMFTCIRTCIHGYLT